MPLPKEVRERLAQAIQNKGLTNYKIAQKLKISATTISNYLKGKIDKPDNTKLDAICRLLDINSHWLYTGQDLVTDSSGKFTRTHPANTLEEKLDEIALILKSKDDQYINLHKDLEYIRKFVVDLYSETMSLKEEVKKLREQEDGDTTD